MQAVELPGRTIPRWAPEIIVSPDVPVTEAVMGLINRAPSRIDVPAITYSEAQPLLVIGESFTVLAEQSGVVPVSRYLNQSAWTELLGSGVSVVPVPDRPAIVAGNVVAHNHWHWLYQCLAPLLVARAQYGTDVIGLVPQLSPIQRESLDMAGIGPDDLVELPSGTAALPPRGIISNLIGTDLAFAPHHAIIDVFERIGALVPSSPFKGARVLISRADAWKRPMSNEAELADALSAKGFRSVVLSKMTLREQAGLFRDASVIVAQHGAGLTNMLFGRTGNAGQTIIELHQEDYLHHAFTKLAQAKGVNYIGIVNPVIEPGPDRHRSIWRCDIDAVLAAIGVAHSGLAAAFS